MTEYKRMIGANFSILFIGHYLFPPFAMNHLFYQLPIRFGPLMARQEIPTCSVGVSIAQMLYLLIHTRYGELRSDRSFGCRIWEVEFEQSLSNSDWSGELSQSLEKAIRQHEPRLKNVRVSVGMTPIDKNSFLRQPDEYRRLATVSVEARLSETEEPFRFSTQLHVGQLAK